MTDAPRTDEDGLELLREYLRTHDAPCPVCGYLLRALKSDICPECGQQLTLQVGSVKPFVGRFLLFLAPMIAGVGFALLWLSVAAAKGMPPAEAWGFYLFLVLGGVDALMLPVFYRWRVSFFAQETDRVNILIAVSWIAHGTLVAVATYGLFG